MLREKVRIAVAQVKNNPVLRRSAAQMKPNKSIWGFLGVVLFFIAPEIVAFAWGAEITDFAHRQMLLAPSEPLATWYETLIYLFKDGGSWFNLVLGFAFLVWLFF